MDDYYVTCKEQEKEGSLKDHCKDFIIVQQSIHA